MAVGFKTGGKKLAELSGWGGWQKNRFVSPATDTNVDVNSYIVGGDMTLNVWMVNVLGSIYSAKGWDQPGSLGASQGIALTVAAPVAPSTRATITNASAVPALGGWFQVLVGPDNLFKAYGGWGGTQSPADAYTGTILASGTATRGSRTSSGPPASSATRGRTGASRPSTPAPPASSRRAPPSRQGQFSLNSQLVF